MDKTGQDIVKFPINGKLCSVEEISELAVRIRAVPEDEYYKFNFQNVTKRILSTEFLSVFVDLYSTNEDIQFRRDATLLLKGISNCSDHSKEGSLKELVDHGITKLILSECVHSDDAELITNIVTVLRQVSRVQNCALLPRLASDGLHGKLFVLLTTWTTNDDIVAILLAAFIEICFHEMEPSKDDDLQDPCNGLLGEVKRNYQQFEGLLGLEKSCKVIVRASVILNKCLGIMGDNEMQERLLPPTDKIFTEDGISKLAGSLDQLKEFLSVEVVGQMIDKQLTTEFVDKFVEAYDGHPDVEYRKNMTNVLGRLSMLEDKDITCSLSQSGVVEYLLKVSEDCADSGVTSNIFDVLKNIAANKQVSRTQLVKMGMLSKIVLLLRKWCKDESVMTSLLSALTWLTLCDVKDIEESLTNTLVHGDIPKILQEILETSTSDSVIRETFYVIRNLSDTELLHKNFMNPNFFSNAFSQLKSGNLENGTKGELLNDAILELANKNPDTAKDMLSPHIESLKELAEADVGEISLNAAAVILLTKYLGCNDFVDKFVETYDGHPDVEYRKNMIYVLGRISQLEDKDITSSLSQSGVVEYLIKVSEDCADSGVTSNIFDELKNIAENLQVNHTQLIEMGMLSKIVLLLRKWRKDESVMTSLLRALLWLSSCDVKDIEESLTNTSVHGDIPNILQEILETSTSDSVINETFAVIKNLSDTELFHKKFMNPKFFSNAFSQLKSENLENGTKVELLNGAIPALANKNPDTAKDMLSPHIESLKELAEADVGEISLNAAAVILLTKYLGCNDFVDQFVETYDGHPDVEYRKNMTHVLGRLSQLEDKDITCSLIQSGVVEYLIKVCEDCVDSEATSSIFDVLRQISTNEPVNHTQLVEMGMLSKIALLLQKWRKDETVMTSLLRVLYCLSSNKVKDIEKSLTNISVHGDIPNILQEILETSTSDSVINETFAVIKNLSDTELLHKKFMNPKFFSNAFSQLKSGNLENGTKGKLLYDAIPALANKNPDTAKDMLSPHIESLKELAEADVGEISINAAAVMLLTKYLGCNDFVNQFVETYDGHPDVEYRKNMTHVLGRLSMLEDKVITCSLSQSGVVEYLLKVSEDCVDSEATSNIFSVLQNIALNGHTSNTEFVEMGMLSKIGLLLRKWCKDESVMISLIRALFWLTYHDVKDIEESLTNTLVHGDIPNILQEILETSTSDSVIQDTISVIKNLSDTELLHKKFMNPKYFSNAFSQLKSENLENGTKVELLNGAILVLADKNPDTAKDMLSPHIESLKELAEADDGEVSINVAAVILLTKHLGCNEITENIQCLVPELDKMFTDEGMSRLASCSKAISSTEEKFERKVVSKIVSAGFIGKIIEAYEKHSEKDYRENLFCVTEKVAYHGDEQAKCSFFETGVLQHFIKACENCTDSEVICHFIDIIKSAVMNSKISQEKLIKMGWISDICSLLKKWCNDESVISNLLNAVYYLITGLEDIEDSLANIPTILQEIVETSTSDRVIDEAFDLIKNIVQNTNALEAEFLNPTFFNSIFKHLKSSSVNSSSIIEVLLGLETKNARKTKDLLNPHIQLLKELSESDDSKVGAILLLHKCQGCIGDTERFKLLVPDLDAIYTKEGVSRLVATIRAIPYTELDFQKQFLVHLVSTGSSDKFIDAFERQNERDYCRDLTYVLKEIVMYAGDDAVSAVVNSGISEHLIKSCEGCSDWEVMSNIATTLQFLTYDEANIIQLGEQGILKCVPTLLKRWIRNKRGESIVDSLIAMLTKMTVLVGVKTDIVSLLNVGVNIPEVLVDIFETSSDVDVLKSTIDCIKNMLTDSMMLHEHFSNQKFIDTCILRTKGDDLDTEYKVKILWSIVTRLSYNNPSKFVELLSPHTQL